MNKICIIIGSIPYGTTLRSVGYTILWFNAVLNILIYAMTQVTQHLDIGSGFAGGTADVECFSS